MEKRILLLIVLIVLVLFSGTVIASCDMGVSEECPVIFFEHELEGEQLEITSPDYFEIPKLQERVLSMSSSTTWNDQISSIAIAEGFKVTVFENENYGGIYKSFTSLDDTRKLRQFTDSSLTGGDPRGTWNNQISSFKIFPITETICDDEIDNNGNDLIDCADPECAGEIGPDENKCCQTANDCSLNGRGAICTAHQCQEESCSDRVDNDGDGLTDCDDADCDGEEGTEGICEFETELTCNDGFDNDGKKTFT